MSNLIESIKKSYSSKCLTFIEKYYEMEGKEYKYKNEHEVANDYSELNMKLFNELMWHRNVPVPEERLNKLRDLKHFLRRDISLVLDSILLKND